MPLAWHDYEAFDWRHAQQHPLTHTQRVALEAWVADVLALPPAVRANLWGSASPPGRYAATVVQIAAAVPHRFLAQAHTHGVRTIGVKVFKPTADALREAQRVLPLHRQGFTCLPGLPHAQVQQTVDAGLHPDSTGKARPYVIQEWVAGQTLADILRGREHGAPLDGGTVHLLITELLSGIIIPLWHRGLIWWDIRAANYCWEPQRQRLILIDIDALAAYADEILATPLCWVRRATGQATALTRLRGLALRCLLAQHLPRRSGARTVLHTAWQHDVAPTLQALGRVAGSAEARETAIAAVQTLLTTLEQAGLLRQAVP